MALTPKTSTDARRAGARRDPDASSPDRYRLLVDSLTDYAILMLDPAGYVMTSNPGAERIEGYTADEIIGQHFSVFYPPGEVAAGKWERELAIAVREGRFAEEAWRVRKDGSPMWADVTITALRTPDAQLTGFAQVTRDITKRRAAEEETARFRLLVESVKDYAIFILDPQGNITTWNPGAERLKGYRAEEIIGRHFSVFYPPEEVAAGKCEGELATAVREGRFAEEGWRLRKDGSRMWASVTITAIRDRTGKLVGFAKVTQDLTSRREAEEQTMRFRLLVESVKDYAIFILDRSGHISTWNIGAERIKGYRADEIIGKHFSVFYPPEDISAGKCEAELVTAATEGRFEEEGWRLRKDGSRMWANVTITALYNPEGEVIAFAKVTRDLTERRRAEENERALAIERATVAEKSRLQQFQERFLAILGHDLRNPLASLDMGAGLLHQRATDSATRRIIDRMRASSLRMSRMIEQILDLTRARLAGGLELKPGPMDLSDSIARVVDELRAVHPSRTIDLRCPPLPGTWDQDRMEQVFSNIISNAIVYGEPSRPVAIDGRVEGGLVSVAVHNYGAPIPEDLQPILFSPFRRGERDSRTAKTEGLGLGLYISNEIVKGHGGHLEMHSSQAAGTTFRISLPMTSDQGSDKRAGD